MKGEYALLVLIQNKDNDGICKDVAELEFCAQTAYRIIGNRWMAYILYYLRNDALRFGELRQHRTKELSRHMV